MRDVVTACPGLITVAAARTSASCSCGWRYGDPAPSSLARAVAIHAGVLAPERPRCCHALCYDDSGHTDGCILGDLDRGDD